MPVPVVLSFTLFLAASAEDCGDDWKLEFCWEGFSSDWALFDMIFANRTMDRDAPQKKPNKTKNGSPRGRTAFRLNDNTSAVFLAAITLSTSTPRTWVSNGTHQAELIPDQVAGSDMWTVLLNFRAAVTQEEAESGGAALEAAEGLAPELREPVEMKVTLVEQNGSETWTEIVVPGEQYAGSKSVLRMKRSQTLGVESPVLRAHLNCTKESYN
ncbi:hypothetical protein CBER1_04494 [Cercospora berteroae]|uniref:Uncharacterized protein n=1 Tax=Cercospora berteroae TaxID=357750 RepID=A0A2S6CF30_9PEZI|nr:hypothetical protein CBER1_04494 [Cercospora berteroae]